MTTDSKLLKELEQNETVLFLVPGQTILKTTLTLVKHSIKKGYHVIYITANRPYATINNIFKKEKIDTKNVFFIDVVTQLTGMPMERAGNCVFSSAQNLTHLSILITKIIQELPKDSKKILFIDCLSSLMIYNKPEIMGKFTISLMAKLRRLKVKCMAYFLEVESDMKLIEHIGSFCDKEVRVR